MKINKNEYSVDKKKAFKAFGKIERLYLSCCAEFSYEMAFGEGHHRPNRSGGDIERKPEDIFLDSFQGKLSECVVREYLGEKMGFEVSDVDMKVYGAGVWDSFDLKWGDNVLSIKSTKYYGNLLLLEEKDWDELGRYIPNEELYNSPSMYDYIVLVRMKFSDDFQKRVKEVLKEKDQSSITEMISNESVEYDIAGFITQDEIAKIVAVDAENEAAAVYEAVVSKILRFREVGESCLDPDFFILYKPSRDIVKNACSYSHLLDIANTMINWLEYTQLAKRNDDKHLAILEEKQAEVEDILATVPSFIDRPEEHEYFQRKYGLDPKHRKDTRNLEKTKTVTARIIAEQKIRSAYIRASLAKPITGITLGLIADIAEETGITYELVEEILRKAYPHGSLGAFMASYFEMAFKGRDECTEFEMATTELFKDVFGYDAKHLGQTGSLSAPDILLVSNTDGYQAIIDNKAYSKYSISGDHHNRMVHNYLKRIETYSQSLQPIGFFAYIAGGFGKSIDKQIQEEVRESGVHGAGITVSNFIKMIENHQNGVRKYSHRELRGIFGIDRQVMLADVYENGRNAVSYDSQTQVLSKSAETSAPYGEKD